ncbi:hypothetical protein, partial [Nitrosomonas communis]
ASVMSSIILLKTFEDNNAVNYDVLDGSVGRIPLILVNIVYTKSTVKRFSKNIESDVLFYHRFEIGSGLECLFRYSTVGSSLENLGSETDNYRMR